MCSTCLDLLNSTRGAWALLFGEVASDAPDSLEGATAFATAFARHAMIVAKDEMLDKHNTCHATALLWQMSMDSAPPETWTPRPFPQHVPRGSLDIAHALVYSLYPLLDKARFAEPLRENTYAIKVSQNDVYIAMNVRWAACVFPIADAFFAGKKLWV